MSHPNSLPGFDAWLQHNPQDDFPEPSIADLQQAERELGPDCDEEELYDRATNIMQARIEASERDHNQHLIDAHEDEMDSQRGDNPWE